MKYLLSTAAIAAMLAASPVLAAGETMTKQAQAQTQTDTPAQAEKPAMDAAKSAEQAKEDAEKAKAEAEKAAMDSGNFIAAQQETDWLSSDLVGQPVLNAQGEALGDVNNVILNQDGKVVALVVGVGGFLGIGQKEVAIRYDTLEFKQQSDVAPAGTAQQNPTGTAPGGSSGVPNAGQSMNQATTSKNPQDSMVIVLDTTRDQLEAAPAYKYIGEEMAAQSGQEKSQ